LHSFVGGGEKNYLQQLPLFSDEILKKAIQEREDLSPAQKVELLRQRVIEIRKEIADRQKLTSQVVTHYIAKIDQALKDNPQATPEAFVDQIKNNPVLIEPLSLGERMIIAETVKAAFEKCKMIDLHHKLYKNKPAKLFEPQFGEKPKGEVKPPKSRPGLGFQMNNLQDYQSAGRKRPRIERNYGS